LRADPSFFSLSILGLMITCQTKECCVDEGWSIGDIISVLHAWTIPESIVDCVVQGEHSERVPKWATIISMRVVLDT